MDEICDRSRHRAGSGGAVLKPGRPTKFTPLARDRIVEALSVGATMEIAAGHGGVTRGTLHRWLSKGAADDAPDEYRAFYDRVKRAENRAAVAALANIQRSAVDGDWRCSAWLLERKFGYRKGGTAGSAEITKAATIEDDPRAFWTRQAAQLEGAMSAAAQAESWQAFAALQRQLLDLHSRIRAYDSDEFTDPLEAMTDEAICAEIVAAISQLPPVLRQRLEGRIGEIASNVLPFEP